MLTDERQKVDRDQVHQVHQEYPDEHRQRQRSNDLALAVVHIFYAVVDKANDQLNGGLQLSGHAAGGVFGYLAEYRQKDHPEDNGEKHRVDVNRPEPRPDLKLRQVVTDILLWSQDFSCRHDASYPYLVKFGNC